MEEIVKLVAERTGMPLETARTAVETVAGFLKERLPEPLKGQVDGILAGGAGGGVDDLLGGLGGLFGKS